MQRHIPANSAAQLGIRPVILIERLKDNHLIAGVYERKQGRNHALGGSAADGHLPLGIKRDAVEALIVSADRIPKLLYTPSDRILIEVFGDRLLCRDF